MRRIRVWLMLLAVAGLGSRAGGFALLGPFPAWQLAAYDGFNIGYNLPGDIGGPQNIGEGYRWNIPVITYGFDQSFINYFGSNGMAAVDAAVKIINDLPPFALITNDASNLYLGGQIVPTDTRRINHFAQTLGLLDVKSTVLAFLVEELGLAEPERWTFAMGGRAIFNNNTLTNWSVLHRNIDPITLQPSPYVNNTLYTYEILEQMMPNISDAVEVPLDPLSFAYTSVAGGLAPGGLGFLFGGLGVGQIWTGLTHDDIGGLRYLYSTNAYFVESVLPDVIGGRAISGGTGSPWGGFLTFSNLFLTSSNALLLTNVFGNATSFIVTGLRPGIGKVVYERVDFDSLIGQTFTPITNRYTDTVISNARPVIQALQRALTFPDVLFTAERLGLAFNVTPVTATRTGTGPWQNNDPVNGNDLEVDGGPGVIVPSVRIALSDQLPYFSNTTPFFLNGSSAARSVIWGSFDVTTNAPIVFPQTGQVTLQFIRAQLGL